MTGNDNREAGGGHFAPDVRPLLSDAGLRVLDGTSHRLDVWRKRFGRGGSGVVIISDALRAEKLDACLEILENHVYRLLDRVESRIPRDLIGQMTRNSTELLPKVGRFRSAVLGRPGGRVGP